jgi:hypothetical protein
MFLKDKNKSLVRVYGSERTRRTEVLGTNSQVEVTIPDPIPDLDPTEKLGQLKNLQILGTPNRL